MSDHLHSMHKTLGSRSPSPDCPTVSLLCFIRENPTQQPYLERWPGPAAPYTQLYSSSLNSFRDLLRITQPRLIGLAAEVTYRKCPHFCIVYIVWGTLNDGGRSPACQLISRPHRGSFKQLSPLFQLAPRLTLPARLPSFAIRQQEPVLASSHPCCLKGNTMASCCLDNV